MNFVPIIGITRIAKFLSDIDFCNLEGEKAVGYTATELHHDCVGLDVELSPMEWREVRRLTKEFARAFNLYYENGEATAPYGYDAEADALALAELEKKLGG